MKLNIFIKVRLERQNPFLKSLGVDLTPIRDIDGCTAYLVQNCLDHEKGCKLAKIGRKPVVCRVGPIGFEEFSRGDKKCPALREIRRQGGDALRLIIREIDRKSGFTQRIGDAQMAARRRMS